MLFFTTIFGTLTVTIKADPRTWIVDDDEPADFQTIQEAVNAASDGDTIQVRVGLYYENVVVNKTVSLIGKDKNNTIIDGNNTGTIITITSDNVKVSGFTIQNIGWHKEGIYLDLTDNNNISHNIITNNPRASASGISLEHSYNNILAGNIVTNNSWGIKFYHSSDNNLTGNIVSNNGDGFEFRSSEYNVLAGNIVTNSIYGIIFFKSSDNVLANNTISNNENGIIMFDSSDNNILAGNIVSDNDAVGISLQNSSNNTLTNNTASNNSFSVWGSSFSHFNNYIDTSNMIDGKPIYYLIDEANVILDAQTNVSTIYLINCNNMTVRDLTLTKNSVGVFFWNTTNSKIKNINASNTRLQYSNNNVLTGNTVDGIYLEYSNNNVLTGNTVSDRERGIELVLSNSNILTDNTAIKNGVGVSIYKSDNNTLIGNIASENWAGFRLYGSDNNTLIGNIASENDVGIVLGYKDYSSEPIDPSNNNTIFHNNFINSTVYQVYSNESTNIWDNGAEGNYWSDYYGTDADQDGIGDTPYIIDENNQDNYPLMNPIAFDFTYFIRKYFPYFIFDEKEEYFPTNFYYDDENIDDNPLDYNETWPLCTYVHTVECYWPPDDKDYLVLEYWFYYSRDDGAISVEVKNQEYSLFDHDHDWESIFVFLEKTETEYIPSWVLYFHHVNIGIINDEEEDCYSAYEWNKIETMDSHPVVHTSRNKHASYAKTFLDYGLCWINIYPIGDFPVIEACDGGTELDYDNFQITYVNGLDPDWPDKFGDIDAPWNKTRWYNPEQLLAFPPIKNSYSVVGLQESQSKLYLHIYDNQSRHVGINYETNKTELGILGSFYFDFEDTIFIILPENITDFTIEVDATYAHEPVEEYEVMLITLRENEVVSEESMSGTIEKGEQHEYVIPEFPTSIVLLVLMILTLIAVVLRKRYTKQNP